MVSFRASSTLIRVEVLSPEEVKTRITSLHPQSDGLAGRMLRTLLLYLSHTSRTGRIGHLQRDCFVKKRKKDEGNPESL